jgi:hypothetical protein
MKGVRSTIHYDESYNFYIQIFGTKRWYFAPPEYYSSCYLYPMAHPSTRQCQLDWCVESPSSLHTHGHTGKGGRGNRPVDLTSQGFARSQAAHERRPLPLRNLQERE